MRRGPGWVVATIPALMLLALALAAYIVHHERLRFPWEARYTIRAEFTNAQAVTPGQGQTVNVSGVKVGDISSVSLHDGLALVSMEIDPHKLPAVYANAHMLLRPRTPLDDMTIELDPGHAPARRLGSHDILPASQTEPAVQLDQVLASLDSDTRDYLRILLNAGARGLQGRGPDLRAALKAITPTLGLSRQVASALDARRADLRALVHNLAALSRQVAGHDASLAELVRASDRTFSALVPEDASLRQSLTQLPGTIGEADATLRSLEPFTQALGPALTRLRPVARKLPGAFSATRPLLRDGTPQLAALTGFARKAQPFVSGLTPSVSNLLGTTPPLKNASSVLDYVANELAYNPASPAHGYLFWLAWFAHNTSSFLSTQDANGAFWRGQLLVSCSSVPQLEQALPLLAPLYRSKACPASGG